MKAQKLINLFVVASVLISLTGGVTTPAQANPGVIYVLPGGTGDGSSWGNATNLQVALGNAVSGDDIWVAEGTYYPGLTGNRLATFQLKNGVAIYGGFDGTESLLSERDWTTNVTILSGDLNGDDGPDFTNNGENAYHVVTGGGTNATAILDGFTITGGNANGSFSDGFGGGMYNLSGSPNLVNITFIQNSASSLGGGMYSYGGIPTLTNVTFSSNLASGGGGMYNDYSSPALTNVTFSGNTLSNIGGGMYNNRSSPTLTNVTFSSNSAISHGGGMYNESSSPVLTNVTFSGNTVGTYGGGMYNNASSPTLTNITFTSNISSYVGGGMYNLSSSPTLTNITFTSNIASFRGGGMYSSGGSPTLIGVTFSLNSAEEGGGLFNRSSSPTLTNVTFSGNTVSTNGGGMYNDSSSPVLTNIIFTSNIASYLGGGMYGYNSSPTLKGVTFSENSAEEGGGMFNDHDCNPILINVSFIGNNAGYGGGIANAKANPTLINAVIFDNAADHNGGGIHSYAGSSPTLNNVTLVNNSAGGGGGMDCWDSCSPTLTNVILWGNTAVSIGPQIYKQPLPSGTGTFTVNYSLVQGGCPAGVTCDSHLLTDDPQFVDAGNGNLRLANTSPGIDAGSNSVMPSDTYDLDGDGDTAEPVPFDLDGSQRFVDIPAVVDTGDGTAPIVDMGAYETQLSSPVIYVDRDSAGPLRDGTSWVTALTSLQSALAAANGNNEIWVAEGTYYPGLTGNRLATFQLKNGVAIYGGFDGTESLLSERDWSTNATILSGDLNGDDGPDFTNNGENAYHVVTGGGTDATAILDGFTITGGNANGYFVDGYGGGMYNSLSSPTLANITFLSNRADSQGGGMYNDSSSPTLQQVIFDGNTTNGRGGGMQNTGGAPILVNVIFRNNTSSDYGGGMHNWSSSPTLTNALFIGNQGSSGAAIENDFSSPILTNVTISGNSATGQGGALYNNPGNPTLTNCILWGNTASSNPEIAYGTPVVSYSIVQGGYAGTGNLDADPLFVVAGVDLRLLPGSPAIDAGDDSAVTASTDLDGNARIVGGSVDMGAYEYQGSNHPPVAVDDEIILLSEGIPVTVAVLANDSDPDLGDTLSVESVSQPAFGEATFNPLDNSVTYTPNNFYGSDSFTYTLSDGNGGTDTATVTVQPTTRNELWTSAYSLQFSSPAVIKQVIDRSYQSRWYKFDVVPGSEIIVTLTGLTADYDLAVYRDIGDSYRELNSSEDLVQLSAEFAPDMFSPDMFSPDMFSPDMFSPDMFSPDMFSPDMFSPDMFSPDMFSPDMFSPDMFSPDMFSPDMFSPDMFSPDMFSPDMFSPDMFSPDMFSPDMFSPDMFSPDLFASAQVRSMIAVSASDGTTPEGIRANSWNESGEFYLRVTGKNGAFDPNGAYQLEVIATSSECGSIDPTLPDSDTLATPGNYNTIVLTDLSRMSFSGTQQTELENAITAFINRSEVAGVWVDVGADARVKAANDLAVANPGCPYAKNLVASAIKGIVDRYRAVNEDTLQYVVIAGNDDVIPFFRYPDNALLANEMDYFPPVQDGTSSQASLKLGYVLGQDEYGSKINLIQGSSIIPIPDLAVGRLVETPDEVMTMLSAYSATQGVLAAPVNGLVMGYDFLADAATAVEKELQAGLGSTAAVNSLIAQSSVAPLDVCTSEQPFDGLCSWTAAQALSALLARHNDVIYLAGHFTANSMLAADNQTRLLSTELEDPGVSLLNTLVLSAGCHSGYNIVDAHGVPGVTREPDWAQLFARKGATFIGGTGYQYGDTDFLEYSERLYLEFTRQLRVGMGPVSLGKALVDAKLAYLANTVTMSGIHEKALIEATFFGLPMLSMDLPTGRTTPEIDAPIVTELQPFESGLGTELSSGYADIAWEPSSPLVETSVALNSLELDGNGDPIEYPANYLSGEDGVVTNPNQPVLPLEMENVSVENTVLRGVGFRGGLYMDQENVLPLTGAAATDIRGVHVPFVSDFFFPVLPWNVNYIGALTGVEGGSTRLAVMPAQFRSNSPVSIYGTLRQYADMKFRLYYSNNIDAYEHLDETGDPEYVYIPAQAAPPLISNITAVYDSSAAQVQFEATVVGDPSAGIQEAWIVYTIEDELRSDGWSGEWKPVDLSKGKVDAQGNTDYRIWTGALALSAEISAKVRFMVVAVNGVGLVSYATNLGAYYTVIDPAAPTPPTPAPTTITLNEPQPTGSYGSEVTFSADVTSGETPVSGEVVVFRLGSQTRVVVSDENGHAEVTLPLLGLPGETNVSASLVGSEDNAPCSTTTEFEIEKQDTQLIITPQASPLHLGESPIFIATLQDADGDLLSGKAVLFELKPAGSEVPVHSEVVATDFTGLAKLTLPLQWIGAYTLSARFGSYGMEDLRYNASEHETILDVDYVFSGFFQPVENRPVLNVVKAGSAIPIKFSLNGNQGLTILDGPPTISGFACGTILNWIDPADTIAASMSGLTYDATIDQYVYVWKTEKSWAGTCLLLTIHLMDGTEHTLTFQFK